MHAPADGREPADGASPFPPAIRADDESTAADPAASGDLLEPFSGPTRGAAEPEPALHHEVEPHVDEMEAEPQPVLELATFEPEATESEAETFEFDAVAFEPEEGQGGEPAIAPEPASVEAALLFDGDETDSDDTPLFEPAEAPWDVLGRAIDDALARAAAAATPATEGTELDVALDAAHEPADADRVMEPAVADLEDLTLDDVVAIADADEQQSDDPDDGDPYATPAAPVLELEDSDAVDIAVAPAVPDAAEEEPVMAPAVPDAAEEEPVTAADRLAARLESLATRLRLDGPDALDEAIRSDDRVEAVVAGVLAGLRRAGVFEAGVPAS